MNVISGVTFIYWRSILFNMMKTGDIRHFSENVCILNLNRESVTILEEEK